MMNKTIQKDLFNVLREVIKVIEKKGVSAASDVSALSNHTIHNASIFQDEDSVSLAVLVYSISKILQRCSKPDQMMLDYLRQASDCLRNNEFGKYSFFIKKCFNRISVTDEKFKVYIEQVVTQSKIKKGSKLYDHGLSLARASSMMGVSQWDLMSYLGKTKMLEVEELTSDIKKKISFTKELFSIKLQKQRQRILSEEIGD